MRNVTSFLALPFSWPSNWECLCLLISVLILLIALFIDMPPPSFPEMPPASIHEYFKMICAVAIRLYPFLVIFWAPERTGPIVCLLNDNNDEWRTACIKDSVINAGQRILKCRFRKDLSSCVINAMYGHVSSARKFFTHIEIWKSTRTQSIHTECGLWAIKISRLFRCFHSTLYVYPTVLAFEAKCEVVQMRFAALNPIAPLPSVLATI